MRRATHYGLLAETVKHYEQTAIPAIDLMLAQSNQAVECTTKHIYCYWWTFALDMGRPALLRSALEKTNMTWSEADATIDQAREQFSFPLRPRGETTEGFTITAELLSWMARIAHALVGGADEVPADEIVASLPSWEEHISIVNAR